MLRSKSEIGSYEQRTFFLKKEISEEKEEETILGKFGRISHLFCYVNYLVKFLEKHQFSEGQLREIKIEYENMKNWCGDEDQYN